MASRKIEVQIVGDAASLQRSFSKASRSARGFERDLGKAGRGAVAASVSFHGLGRSIAFASSAFLGGAGLVYGIKSTITAAEKSQSVLAQTQVAVRKTGNSWREYGQRIRDAALAQSNLSGFDDERLLTTFSSLVRATGDVNKALKLNALAANLARGQNISLESAAKLVTKANAGMAGAVRRVLPFLNKNASATQLIAALQQKYAGAAVAYGNTAAGAQDRFRVAVENLQEAIGAGLLPEITRILNPLSQWLNNSKNQARVQRDVNHVAKAGAAVFRDVSGAVSAVSDKVGGFKRILELLIEIKLVTWAVGIGRSFGLVGGSAVAANGEVLALRASLLSIGGMAVAPIVIPLMIDEIINGKHGLTSKALTAASNAAANAVGMAGKSTGLPTYAQYQKAAKHKGAEFASIVAVMRSHGITNPNQLPGGEQPTGVSEAAEAAAKAAAGRARSTMTQASTTTAGGGGGGASSLDRLSQIQNSVAAARLAVSRGDKGAKGQLVAALKREIDFDAKYALIQQRLAARGGKDAKKHAEAMRALLADESSAYDEITGLTKTERAKRKKNKKKAIQSFAEPFRLQLAEAKAGTTKTDSDDLKVWKTMRSWTARMIKANKFRGQALIDAWNEIARLNDNIANAAHTSAKQIATTSTKLLTANLGLSRAQRVELEQRIAQAQAHRFHVPNGQVGALGQVVNIGPVHVHGVQDPKKLIDGLAKHAKRKTSSTRGTHAGANLGLH